MNLFWVDDERFNPAINTKQFWIGYKTTLCCNSCCVIQIFIHAADHDRLREQASIKQSIHFHNYCCKEIAQEAHVDMSLCELDDTGMHAATFSALKPVNLYLKTVCTVCTFNLSKVSTKKLSIQCFSTFLYCLRNPIHWCKVCFVLLFSVRHFPILS